ncbi:MAG: 2-oxoglutarate and iron-dependent oxygenase domain-containing protein [Alphaproteobacteria bacterium]
MPGLTASTMSGRAQQDAAGFPVLDLAGYLSGAAGERERLASELHRALTTVGFFFIVGHGISQAQIDAVFAQAARFHALPTAAKDRLKFNKHNIGYVALGAGRSRSSAIAKVAKPNLNAAFFMKRERAPDDPDVVNDVPMRGLNQWPDGLPGFRETLIGYFDAMEALARRLLPLYAGALGLPAPWFDPHFADAQITLRLSHYPSTDYVDEQYGLAPHTDAGFMTLLANNDVPGLSVRPDGRDWMAVPDLPGAFLVNSGDILRRWSNDRLLSTAHRVRNEAGRARYAIPFFYDPRTDVTIECLPTCCGTEDPPRHAPIVYGDYLGAFMARNYEDRA